MYVCGVGWGEKRMQPLRSLNDTMAFFDRRKSIFVHTEASFHKGLSAGLFQRTGKRLLFISSLDQ